MWQDIKYGLRMLAKAPGFTAIAVLTLALGIGANTAIFSMTYGILLKPLPYPHPSRLVQIVATHASPNAYRTELLSNGEFDGILAQNNAFDQVSKSSAGEIFTLKGFGEPESVPGFEVSGNFFSIYGIPPLLGRPILPGDTQPGHGQVAVLGYALWRRHFGGDPGVIGKSVELAIQKRTELLAKVQKWSPYTIVGVMPPYTQFPVAGNLWVPLVEGSDARSMTGMGPPQGFHSLSAVARLKGNATAELANTELGTISSRLAADSPEAERGWSLSATPLQQEIVSGYSRGLLILFGAVSFVLLLACVNVSSMFAARGWARQKEIAIRETLGATRVRLLRQLLTESVLLALISGALSLAMAYWVVDLVRAIAPAGTPRLDEIKLDWTVLVYGLGTSFVAGTLFGVAPAVQLTRREVGAAIKGNGTGEFGGVLSARPRSIRNLLIVTEIALAFVLVTGSALTARSLSNLTNVHLGFRLDHVLTMNVRLSSATCPNLDACNATIDGLLDRVSLLAGVKNVAVVGPRPFTTMYSVQLLGIEGKSGVSATAFLPAEYHMVTPRYFRAMGIPFLAGRSFTGSDTKSSTLVAIINETMARRYFNGSPLGKRFTTIVNRRDQSGQPDWVEVVGEVGDTRDTKLQADALPEIYVPFSQATFVPQTYLMIRTALNPLALASAVRKQVWTVDEDAAVEQLATMEQVMSEQLSEPRFRALLLGAFGGLGLILAMVGIYGVISYGVSQRTHEIGVRMALGAQPGNILRMVIREGMLLVGVGIVVGIGGALALTRFLRSLLFEIKPTDPATFVGVTIALALVALAACWIPARRAMRVEPMEALRYE